MIIEDTITKEILTINDYMDACREAHSRVKFYNSQNKDYEHFATVIKDKITILNRRA